MEALIHHFKLVTEGFQVPQARSTQPLSPLGVSSECTWSATAALGRTAHMRDPSFTNLQSIAAMTEGGLLQ